MSAREFTHYRVTAVSPSGKRDQWRFEWEGEEFQKARASMVKQVETLRAAGWKNIEVVVIRKSIEPLDWITDTSAGGRARAPEEAVKQKQLAFFSGYLLGTSPDPWERKSEHHFQLRDEDLTVDFWPTTGLVRCDGKRRGTAITAPDLEDILRDIRRTT